MKSSCRRSFAEALERAADDDARICLVCTDSRGSASVDRFAAQHPDRFFEMGIAEQNAVSVAAGLASVGMTAFVAGPACFVSSRSYEQVKVDVAYNRANVKIIGVSAGVSYGPLGGTHTSLNDIAALRALPGIEIYAPSDGVQTAFVIERLARSTQPAYVRIGRGDVEAVYAPGEAFELHAAKRLRGGDDVALIACGEAVSRALHAADRLAARGVQARVLDLFCLKPADEDAIVAAARETRGIVTIEEHSVIGGLGELVCGIVARRHPVPVCPMGFPDEEIAVGSSEALYAHYGITPEGIADAALRLIGEGRG